MHLCVSRNVHHVPLLFSVHFKELIYMHYMTRLYQWNAREIMIFPRLRGENLSLAARILSE